MGDRSDFDWVKYLGILAVVMSDVQTVVASALRRAE